MDQQKLQAFGAQLQDEINQAVAGFKAKGWEHFKKVLAVAGVLAVVGYIGLYRTTSSQLMNTKRKVSQLRDISKHALEYRDYHTKLGALKDKFPTEADRKSWLFDLVIKSAKEHGIAIDSISSQREEERSDMPFLRLSIDVLGKGGYHNIGAWVAKLEGTGRFTQVETLSITKARDPNPDQPPSGQNNVQITLTTVIPKGMAGL